LKSVNVISEQDLLQDLSVHFKGEEVKNLTVSKLAIWNSGKITIEQPDVPNTDPILISIKSSPETNNRIYQVEILKVNEPSNAISIETIDEGKVYKVSFDYLDFNQGALFKVIHSGKSSDDIKISGIVKGFGKIVDKGGYVFEGLAVSSLKARNADGTLIYSKRQGLILYLAMLIFSLLLPALFRFKSSFTNTAGFLLAALCLITMVIIVFYNPIPNGFEILEDDEFVSKKKRS
jgi:hypothetical protein